MAKRFALNPLQELSVLRCCVHDEETKLPQKLTISPARQQGFAGHGCNLGTICPTVGDAPTALRKPSARERIAMAPH
jgi:hypothetical protein